MKQTQTVFITGASSGIGKETALFFAKKGWDVIATMRHPEKETELTNTQHITCMHLDVTKKHTIEKCVEQTIKKCGRIDVVINNAGFATPGPFEASTEDGRMKQFETNVLGAMNVTQEFLPHLRKQGFGTLVVIASMGGRLTFPYYSIYHATKWAVEGFFESLQYELRQYNIKIKIIEPGIIQTDFYDESTTTLTKQTLYAYNESMNQALSYMMSEGKNGSNPKGVAKTIYNACTDNSWKLRYQTGKYAKLLLTLRHLPDSVFTFLIRKAVFRNT